MEVTCGGVSSVVESSLYHNVHSILRELDCEPQAGSACHKGMLRWTLHNRVDRNPSVCVPLLRVLIKELEKAERIDSKIRIIPLLHTLVYTVLQAVFIPADLCRRIYLCLKSLVTLPVPYCSIALGYARQMKMEQSAPGILYQRRVSAEHGLRNDFHPQEKVFVFVDPAVFPLSLLSALKADVECVYPAGDPLVYKRRVLLHTILSGLGKQCRAEQLTQALEGLGEDLELYFQDLVSILEQRAEDGASEENQYKTRLQDICRDILTNAKDPSCPASPAETHLPGPEVSFHIWTREDEIWNELVNYALMFPADRSSAFLEDDDLKRSSVMSTVSTDSGIEGDMGLCELSSLMLEPPSVPDEQSRSQSFYRRPCVRAPKSGNRTTLVMEAIKGNGGYALAKEERNLTARIVVMGDDRTLGRLAKTLYTIRKREARHLLLTKRVNLEMYYIPVSDQPPPSSAQDGVPEDMLTLAGYLGSLDPWYDCNINGLGAMILKLAQMQSCQSESSQPNTFLLDIISYYTRVGQHPLQLPVYCVKICFSSLSSAPAEEVFVAQLAVDFPLLRRYRNTFKDTIKGSVRYKKYNPQELYGAVVSVNYRKASVSDREEERGMSLSTSGILISVSPSCRVKSLHSVNISFQDVNPMRPSTPPLRAVSVSIRVLEQQTFTVCLDKDQRKTFTNVQSIEVSPCLDPGYCQQLTAKSKYSLGEEGESLRKYLNKTLTLPINTFCGSEQ